MKLSEDIKILTAILILIISVSCRETIPETQNADEPAEKAERLHQEQHDEGVMMADDMPMEEESMEH